MILCKIIRDITNILYITQPFTQCVRCLCFQNKLKLVACTAQRSHEAKTHIIIDAHTCIQWWAQPELWQWAAEGLFTWAEQRRNEKTRLWAERKLHTHLSCKQQSEHTRSLASLLESGHRLRETELGYEVWTYLSDSFQQGGDSKHSGPLTHTHNHSSETTTLVQTCKRESAPVCCENRFTFHSNVPVCSTSGVTSQCIQARYNSWEL